MISNRVDFVRCLNAFDKLKIDISKINWGFQEEESILKGTSSSKEIERTATKINETCQAILAKVEENALILRAKDFLEAVEKLSNQKKRALEDHTPLFIQVFSKFNDNLHAKEKYQILNLTYYDNGPSHLGEDLVEKSKTIATNNSFFNRYSNILPYDSSSEELKQLYGINFYINASPMEFNGRRYIATQNPLEFTLDHFVQMVIQSKARIVVTLLDDKVIEGETYDNWWKKCSNPNEKFAGNSFYRLPLTQTHLSEGKDDTIRLVIRNFRVVTSQESYVVKQFHYKGWRNHDSNQIALLNTMIDLIDLEKPDPYPLIVHCSAGIGRTGTFIAIDSLKECINSQLMQEKPLNDVQANVFDRVVEMRKKRGRMVQSWEQLQSINRTLLARYTDNQPSKRILKKSE